jgi:hypothetical protein
MLPRSLPVLYAFFAARYFVPHITQKAKPAFPPALARTCCQGRRSFDLGLLKASLRGTKQSLNYTEQIEKSHNLQYRP